MTSFVERLKARTDAAKPSHSQLVRDSLSAIESALAAGVTRAEIVEDLKASGAPMSIATLATYLARHRKAARDSAHKLVQTPQPDTVAPSPSVPPLKPVPEGEPTYGAHDPRTLDAIMRSTPDLKALAKLAPKTKR
jgi:hypothetical protein